MFDGREVVSELKGAGVTDVVWIPDSVLGLWEPALMAESGLRLIRVCRESEAIGVAAGLYLGGRAPVIAIQCTGLFDAGDALRNFVHDFKLPLFFIIGLRSYLAHQQGKTTDTCPIFAEPILAVWKIPFQVLTPNHTAADVAAAYRLARQEQRAGAVFLAE